MFFNCTTSQSLQRQASPALRSTGARRFVARQMVADCIAFQLSGKQLIDYTKSKTNNYGYWYIAFYRFFSLDTLQQLIKNKVLVAKFNERLIKWCSTKART